MKPRNFFATTSLFLAAVIGSAQAEVREFTSADGRQIQAELVGYAAGVASLKVASGKVVPLPISKLSKPDQEFVDLWATDPTQSLNAADITMDQYLGNLGYDFVTYDDDKGSMIIEMTFGDLSRKFIVNTNLPYSYLDGPIADSLGMQTKPTGDFLATFSGPQAGINEGKLTDFTMGKSLFSERIFRVVNLVPTGINNLGIQIDGILGYDFLQEYGGVIDYKAKRVFFLPPPPPKEQ